MFITPLIDLMGKENTFPDFNPEDFFYVFKVQIFHPIPNIRVNSLYQVLECLRNQVCINITNIVKKNLKLFPSTEIWD